MFNPHIRWHEAVLLYFERRRGQRPMRLSPAEQEAYDTWVNGFARMADAAKTQEDDDGN